MWKITEQQIVKLLDSLKVSKSNRGFRYTISALKMLLFEDRTLLDRMGELYRKVAKRELSTYNQVERALRYEVECVFRDCDNETLDKLFGKHRGRNNRVPNREFLAGLYYALIYSEEETKDE